MAKPRGAQRHAACIWRQRQCAQNGGGIAKRNGMLYAACVRMRFFVGCSAGAAVWRGGAISGIIETDGESKA
jgi:hypothetical protein